MTFVDRQRPSWLIACTFALCANSAVAQVPPLPAADSVSSVWNLSVQPCNGGGMNLMNRSKDQAVIRQSRRIDLPSIGLSMSVPQLPGVAETTVKLFLNDRSRTVVDHYILFAAADLDTPLAAVVVTELPPALDTQAKVFSVVVALERKSAAPAGITPEFQRISGPFGDALETIVPGRIGTHCFPTSDWELAAPGEREASIGISRFVHIGNKLVEFALIVRVNQEMDLAARASYARKLMDGYWQGLVVRGPGNREGAR